MREIDDTGEILLVAKALGSGIRMNIVNILNAKKQMNLNDLSEELGVTNGAITSHIKMLSKAGIIGIRNSSGIRGSQKICFLKESSFLIELAGRYNSGKTYEAEIPVGTYTSHEAFPTCGIATKDGIIGEVDDPRYFDDPQRFNAGIVWITSGFFEYRIPNYLKRNQTPKELQISFEIASEAPGFCDDWPSDICFFINGYKLGIWVSPGDYGGVKGLYTPGWWPTCWNQYGLLKLLSVNSEGSFIDGVRISGMKISDIEIGYNSDLIFKIAVSEDSENAGGMTLLGKGFGNYHQDIKARVIYE